jgi:hypothetical protein
VTSFAPASFDRLEDERVVREEWNHHVSARAELVEAR